MEFIIFDLAVSLKLYIAFPPSTESLAWPSEFQRNLGAGKPSLPNIWNSKRVLAGLRSTIFVILDELGMYIRPIIMIK